MGMKFMFSCGSIQNESYNKNTKTSPNPNKYNFEIKKELCKTNNHYLLLVNYPDCTTFNGDKLIIIKGELPDKELDPHFFENGNVIARFKPDKEGEELGILLMVSIANNLHKVK